MPIKFVAFKNEVMGNQQGGLGCDAAGAHRTVLA